MLLDNAPAVCCEFDDSDLPVREILLITKVAVTCQHDLESGVFGGFKQITVSLRCPALPVGGFN